MKNCVTYSPVIFPLSNASFQMWPWSCFNAVVLRSELICQMTFLTTASMTMFLLKSWVIWNLNFLLLWDRQGLQFIHASVAMKSMVIWNGTVYSVRSFSTFRWPYQRAQRRSSFMSCTTNWSSAVFSYEHVLSLKLLQSIICTCLRCLTHIIKFELVYRW